MIKISLVHDETSFKVTDFSEVDNKISNQLSINIGTEFCET